MIQFILLYLGFLFFVNEKALGVVLEDRTCKSCSSQKYCLPEGEKLSWEWGKCEFVQTSRVKKLTSHLSKFFFWFVYHLFRKHVSMTLDFSAVYTLLPHASRCFVEKCVINSSSHLKLKEWLLIQVLLSSVISTKETKKSTLQIPPSP